MNFKRILFLHPNYPGQFKTLALAISKLSNSNVKFLCMTNYGMHINGIKDLVIKGNHGQIAMEKLNLSEIEKIQFRAESYRLAFNSLKNSGWNPDIVIGHTGWGCGIHVKDVWNNCLFIGYSEWWFNLNSVFFASAIKDRHMGIKEINQIKSLRRNQPMALELCKADKIITPSAFQKSQLPKTLQEKCMTIHDGIDIEYFRSNVSQPSKTPVITYGTRGMEPMRCFKQFIKSIPYIIQKIPSIRIEIMGTDQICYGGLPPNDRQSWGEWAKQYLRDANVDSNVLWKGSMDYASYKIWLQQSWCHVYLSQPFVTSWSLLESLITGIPIVANNILPIEEFTRGAEGVYLLNSTGAKEILEGVLRALTDERTEKLYFKRFSRDQTCETLSTGRALQQWERVTGLKLHTNV